MARGWGELMSQKVTEETKGEQEGEEGIEITTA